MNDFLLAEKSTDCTKIIDQLKGEIPIEDIPKIRAANYVRNRFNSKSGGVGRLKEDIGHRWGQRGRNITNLMTAGYFENYIIPVLKGEIAKPIPSITFSEFYEIVVNETAFSIFVPKAITEEELKTQIIHQSIRNVEEFNRDYISIHALVRSNVDKVKTVVSVLQNDKRFLDFVIKKHIYKYNKIFIQLNFGLILLES